MSSEATAGLTQIQAAKLVTGELGMSTKTAAAIGKTAATVREWRRRGIPWEYHDALLDLAAELGRPKVTREVLRIAGAPRPVPLLPVAQRGVAA